MQILILNSQSRRPNTSISITQSQDFVLGVIPARGNSRRLLRKNLKILGNKPLVVWTIEAMKNAKSLNYYLVSTDDNEIAEISRKAGANVPFKRPAEISTDCDTSLVSHHALEWYEQTHNQKVSYVVTCQPTSPFRLGSDIDNCVQIAKATKADTVVSITKARESPYWTFEVDTVTQQLRNFMDMPLEGENLVSQNLPLLWYPNGAVYVTNRKCILEDRLYGPVIYGYRMPENRSLDIDTEMDYVFCSAMLPFLDKEEWVKYSWTE